MDAVVGTEGVVLPCIVVVASTGVPVVAVVTALVGTLVALACMGASIALVARMSSNGRIKS